MIHRLQERPFHERSLRIINLTQEVSPMKKLSLFLLFSLAVQPLYAIGIYKWIDDNGKETYGNNPPENVVKNQVTLPEITIIAGPKEYQETSNSELNSTVVTKEDASQQQEENVARIIEIISPKDDEAIRANDGNISIRFNIEPKLKEGESIVVYLDGKQQTISSSPTVKFESLDRGTHSLFAVRRDASGNATSNSKNIKFHVLRHFR